jgi:hypothetical protein
MRFDSEPDALQWVAERAADLELGAMSEKRDASGRLLLVSGVSVGSPQELADKRANLLEELGGTDQRVIVGVTPYSLRADTASRIGTVKQALCSGTLCTEDESYRDNYILYHELGSRTSVTAGGYEVQHQTISGQGVYECVDLPGPLPVTCTGYCNYSGGCPSGFSVESRIGYPTCQTVCRGDVRNVTIRVQTRGFNGQVQTLSTQDQTTHDSSLEVSYWEWGVSGGVVSQANGVCGVHGTQGPDGSVSVKSHDGDIATSTCDSFSF